MLQGVRQTARRSFESLWSVFLRPTEIVELFVLWRSFWWGAWEIIPGVEAFNAIAAYSPLLGRLDAWAWAAMLVVVATILFALVVDGVANPGRWRLNAGIRFWMFAGFAVFWTTVTALFLVIGLDSTAIPSYGYNAAECYLCSTLLAFRLYGLRANA